MASKEKQKQRLGCMKPGKEGAAAEFKGEGRASGPVDFDAQKFTNQLGLWWKSGGGNNFVMGDDKRGFSVWPEAAVTDKMRHSFKISIKAREGQFLSDCKQVFLWARENRCVEEVFSALPGYRSGVHDLESGERVLIKTSPRLVEPKAGKWEVIEKLITGQLDRSSEGDVDQTVYFYSWLKVAIESLLHGEPGQWRQGHALLIPGPAGGGKSRLQENIITPLLGGREANPKKFLFNEDDHNADVFSAEHLSLGEIPSSQKTTDRVELAETIKQVVANSAHRMRLMRVDPWTVHPYWRLSITLNDEPDRLRSLPVITRDFGDKVLILHSTSVPLPMPTDTDEERKAFRDAIKSELPAFAHYLLKEFKIPEKLLTYPNGKAATRFGFREFHHPVITGGLFDETPAAELMQLIDMADFSETDSLGPVRLWDLKSDGKNGVMGKTWHGRAQDLQLLLTGKGEQKCSVDTLAQTLFRYNPCATLLGRLNATEGIGDGVRIMKGNTRTWKGWIIGPPSPAD